MKTTCFAIRILAVISFAVFSEGVVGQTIKAKSAAAAAKEEVKKKKTELSDVEKGKEVFKKYCAACHGDEGKGDGPASGALEPKPRNLADSSYTSKLTDEYLTEIMKNGGAAVGKSPLMVGFGPAASEENIKALIAFIRAIGEDSTATKEDKKAPAKKKDK